MRSKSNKIQFIALAFIMLFSVMNAWGIEVSHEETSVYYDRFLKESDRKGQKINPKACDYDVSNGWYKWYKGNQNLLDALDFTWENSPRDLSEFSYILVQSEILVTGSVSRVVITVVDDDGNNHDYAHFVNQGGEVRIPLSNEDWLDYSNNSPIKMNKNTMLKRVKQIRFGGYSDTGNVKLNHISLVKARNVEWDVNGCIQLEYQDIGGDMWWTSRDGDYIEKTDRVREGNNGNYATFRSHFDQSLQIRSVTFNGKVYDGANNLISKFGVRVNNSADRVYLNPDFNTAITKDDNNRTLSSITDVEMILTGTGSMHLYNIIIKHKDVKTVTFDSNGGSFCAPIDYYRTAITLPTPTKDSYVFDGWYNGKTKVTNPSSYKPTQDIELKAKWKTGAPAFDVTQNRIYYLNFEEMSNNDLLSGDGAPTGVPTSDQQGKYYNYGGKGRILKDSNVKFGNYYQNLAVGTDEFTNSHAENFLRIVFTDAQKQKFNNIVFHSNSNGEPDYSHPKPVSERAATIGFWVNAKLANKYELPLERGSMFCMFSNERFQKADDDLKPRYMFDIACNGWVYSYMPNSYYVTQKDENGDDIKDSEGNPQQVLVEYMNKFHYGETADVVENGMPLTSLFGAKNYAHTQDQRQHKFYDDNNWHYVTYVATNDLKYVTMYLDGEKVGEQDMSMLEGEDNCQFDENGDYGARVFYLRNLVLGGFTPHGLFFNGPKKGGQYYSDAALAYDDISIYSVALTQSQIRDIIATKNYVDAPTEWHFRDALKSYSVTNNFNIGEDKWVSKGNGVYELRNPIGTTSGQIQTSPLLSGGANSHTLFSTKGLEFIGGQGKILIDTKNGLIGLKYDAQVYIPNVKQYENIYFVVKSENPESYKINQYDIAPMKDQGATFFTRGVSGYGNMKDDDMNLVVAYCITDLHQIAGKRGFVMYNFPGIGQEDFHKSTSNDNILWFSDIIVSPYCLVYAEKNIGLAGGDDVKNLSFVDVELKSDGSKVIKDPKGTVMTSLPKLIIHKGNKNTTEAIANYSQNTAGNPYLRFSSSAPHVAHVNSSGEVTLTGLAGNAIIKAELIFGNLHDDCLSTTYEIRVKDRENTNYIAAGVESLPVGSSLNKGDVVTGKDKNGNDMYEYKVNESSDILVSLGGWPYKDNSYDGKDGSVTDSWVKPSGNGYLTENDMRPIDNYEAYVVGSQNAASESLGLNENFNNAVSDGKFIDKSRIDGVNQELDKPMSVKLNETAWRLPCRGTYVKVQPQKAGVVSLYILQNGNLGNEQGDGNDKHRESVSWRPVYVVDETGRVLGYDELLVTSNSRISQNDNFFRQGRRRGQFIGELADITINKTFSVYDNLRLSLANMKRDYPERYKTLMADWANAGWKQRIIKSGDGGHMIMSKGMMRYTFNVYPGKTYYIFSNDTKIGISGYNFKADKLLKKGDSGYYLDNVSKTTSKTVFEDAVDGTVINGKTYEQPLFPNGKVTEITYNRTFTPGKWGSICLPFSMNNKQMKENFGDETAVVLLKEIDSEGVVQMVWHVNQDIIAGYPYFILPRGKVKGADVASITQINTNAYFDPAVTAPSFMVGPKMKNSQSATVSSVDELGYTTSYPYVFTGNFATETATAGSYVMLTSGVLTKVSNTPSIKPFRAYLKYCETLDPTINKKDPLIDGVAEVKPLNGMGYKNLEGEETTTSIEQILEANGIFIDSANVYGVDGQVKRYNTHDLNGLPKGIYIVNGKKYVVK